MKNKKYLIIGIIIGLLLIVGVGTGVYIYLNSNHLTISEKNWIDENHTTSQVININVIIKEDKGENPTPHFSG